MHHPQQKQHSLDLNIDSNRGNYSYTRLQNLFDHQSTLKRFGSQDNRQLRNTFDYDPQQRGNIFNGNETNDFQQSLPMQSQVQQQRLENMSGYQQLSPLSKQYMKKKLNQSVQLYNNTDQVDYDSQSDQIQQPLGYFQQPLSSPINTNLRGQQQQSHYHSLGNFSTQNTNSYVPPNTQNQQISAQQQIINTSPAPTTMSQSTMIPNSQHNISQQYYLPLHQRALTKVQQTPTQMNDLSDYDSNQSQNKMRYSQNIKNNSNNISNSNINAYNKTSTIPTEASDISYDSNYMNNRMKYFYQENQQLANELQDALNQSKPYSLQDSISQRKHKVVVNPKVKSKLELNSSADSLTNRMNKDIQPYQSKRDSVVIMNQEQVENIQSQLDEIKAYLQKQNQVPKGNEYKQSTLQTDLLLNKIIKRKTENFEELKDALSSVTQSKEQQNLFKRQSSLAQTLAETLSAPRMAQSRQTYGSKQKMINVPNLNSIQKNDNNTSNTNNNSTNLNTTEKNETIVPSMQSSVKSKLQNQPKPELKQNKSYDATSFNTIKQSQTEREEQKKRGQKMTQYKGVQSQEYLQEGISKDTLDSAIECEEDSARLPTENKSNFGLKSLRKSSENLLEQLEQKEEMIKQLNKQILLHQQEQIQAKITFESEKGQLKNEIILLEGRLKQKEQFEEEKLKNDEVLKEQQQFMKKNQETIIQEVQSKNTQLANDIQKAEKQLQELNMQAQNYQSQSMYMSNLLKEKDLFIEKVIKENQSLSGKAQNQMFNQGKSQQQLNDASFDQKSLKDLNLGNSGNMMGMQYNYDQISKQYSQALEQKDRELKQLSGTLDQLNLKIKQYEEQFAHIATSDQQFMMKQLQISKGTIEQLNCEIERYKSELFNVQQFSINVSTSKTVKSNAGNQSLIQFKQNNNNNDQDLIKQLQNKCDMLKADNDELKAKEADYEQSINKLKAGFYEESETRKELENKLQQIAQKSNFQQYQSGESASKVVKELIQRKKNENNPSSQFLNNHMSSDAMNDISLLQEIIQGMTIQINETQTKFEEERDKLKNDIKKIKQELEQKKQECQKNQLEIKKLNKELEFSEIKETLNDREEEMSQMKQKNEELQKQIKQIQEKHLHDRNQIIKENESYADRLRKEYEERINCLKQITTGGSNQQLPSSMFDENKEQTNFQEQINVLQNELTLCKNLYQKALNEEMVQTQQLINSLNNALLEKRDKIEKYEEQKGEMQTQITVFNSQCKQFQESLLTASMSVTLESSHVFRDGQGEILKTLIEKVKEKKKLAQERANKLEKDNKKLQDENKKIQLSVRELEHRNTEIENLSHASQQEYVILQERMKDYVEEDKKKSEEIQMLKSQLSTMSVRSQKLDMDSNFAGMNNANGADNFQLIDINSQSLLVTDGTQSQLNTQQEMNDLLPQQAELNNADQFNKDHQAQSEQTFNKQTGPIVIDQVYKQNIAKEYDSLLAKYTEVQKKYKQAHKQLEEKVKSETIMQNIIQTELAKRKSLEINYKNKQDDNDKLEKLLKSKIESNKRLNQKNAQNESIKAFFENQMKEYKDIIDKLQEQKKELEDKLKGKMSNSSYHSRFMQQADNSYYASNIGSSIGESSVIDPNQLLNELNEKINENCQLNMKIDQLNEQIKVLSQNTNQSDNKINSSTQLKNLVQEKQQLQQQIKELQEENEILKSEIHQKQLETQLVSLETSDLKVKYQILQNKVSEQQEIINQNLQQINLLQSRQNNVHSHQNLSQQEGLVNSQINIEQNNILLKQMQNINDCIDQEDLLCQSAELAVQYNPEQKQKEDNVLKDLKEFQFTLNKYN